MARSRGWPHWFCLGGFSPSLHRQESVRNCCKIGHVNDVYTCLYMYIYNTHTHQASEKQERGTRKTYLTRSSKLATTAAQPCCCRCWSYTSCPITLSSFLSIWQIRWNKSKLVDNNPAVLEVTTWYTYVICSHKMGAGLISFYHFWEIGSVTKKIRSSLTWYFEFDQVCDSNYQKKWKFCSVQIGQSSGGHNDCPPLPCL